MVIRDAIADDLPQLLELYAELNPGDPKLDFVRAAGLLDQILAGDGSHLLVAEENDLLVATCHLSVIANLSRDGSPYGLVENVVTRAGHRKQGIGKSLLELALARAWSLGCYKVMLLTGSRRESTQRFYRSCGFQAGEKFAFVAHPRGWSSDA